MDRSSPSLIIGVLIGIVGTLLITGYITEKYFINRQFLKNDLIYIEGKFFYLKEYCGEKIEHCITGQ